MLIDNIDFLLSLIKKKNKLINPGGPRYQCMLSQVSQLRKDENCWFDVTPVYWHQFKNAPFPLIQRLWHVTWTQQRKAGEVTQKLLKIHLWKVPEMDSESCLCESNRVYECDWIQFSQQPLLNTPPHWYSSQRSKCPEIKVAASNFPISDLVWALALICVNINWSGISSLSHSAVRH